MVYVALINTDTLNSTQPLTTTNAPLLRANVINKFYPFRPNYNLTGAGQTPDFGNTYVAMIRMPQVTSLSPNPTPNTLALLPSDGGFRTPAVSEGAGCVGRRGWAVQQQLCDLNIVVMHTQGRHASWWR
jgi:hypothetical protein